MSGHVEGTRPRLLEATVEILLERGWGGVSTRVVAERAAVRPGLVHYHFGSIDDLRREAAITTLRAVVEPFIEMAQVLAPVEVMDAIADASVDEFAPGTPVTNLLYEVLPVTVRDRELQEALADVLGRFRVLFAASIRRHHPHALVDPEILAELVAATIDGLQLHLLADPGLDLRTHLHALLPLLGPAATTPEAGR